MSMAGELQPQGERSPVEKRERARQIAALVIVGISVAFAAVNLRNVKVDWIVGSAKTPLIVVIAVCVLLGAGIDRVMVTRSRKRAKPEQ
jgi:uncharacterized integral membrane protein